MRMLDILEKKKRGGQLSKDEIAFFVCEYTAGSIPDYQASALLMAICLKGMNEEEAVALTDCMAHSGDMLDLSAIDGITADKHSTGGVGDKTTLIVAPICASCGLKIAKMSGRGLGHTGGTVDKLESIPGYRTALSNEEFFAQVNRVGVSIIGQTGDLAPADKLLYALRDATATVDNIALIASSIMSKKLAAGAQNIALDVKCGSGAFMQTKEDAEALAKLMVKIGKSCGRNTAAVITDMDTPLGTHIGNALEVTEAAAILQNRGDTQLRELCLTLSAHLLSMSYGSSYDDAYKQAETALIGGKAFLKMQEWVEAQGGDAHVLSESECFRKAAVHTTVTAQTGGYLTHMDTHKVGESASLLGAGRAVKTDSIDPAAGIVLYKKTGDAVRKGEPIAELFASSDEKLQAGKARFLEALTFGEAAPKKRPLILGTVV